MAHEENKDFIYEDTDTVHINEDDNLDDDYYEENEEKFERVLSKDGAVYFLRTDGTWFKHTTRSDETANKIEQLFDE